MDSQKEFERVKKYAASWDKVGNYAIAIGEVNAITDCSINVIEMISIAFRFGFEKGCRATKKAAKV